MHAYQDDVYANEDLINEKTLDFVIDSVKKKSEQELKNILETVNKISPNPRHSYRIISSNNVLLDEVDRIVDLENIDIIVMGTKGKANVKKVTFGSHTLQVLRYVQCPVLAIPEHYKYTQVKHILFPTNYLIPYKRRELKLLCEMAFPYRAIIDILYISKTRKLSLRQQDNQDFIKAELCKNTINFKVINSQHFINTIFQYIKENHIQMLVMVNTRHSFLENILFQSTIDKLSLHLDIPFLALQNMKRN